jgi:hypothetical protein
MATSGIAEIPAHFPIVDWEIERDPLHADVLLRFRYFTDSMQDLDEAERGPVYALTTEKAADLRAALDAMLRRR